MSSVSRICAWLTSVTGRRAVGFWLAGLLNNSIFVIMNAGGKHLNAGGVGIVYFCNIFPSVFVKGTSAFWFHLVGYEQRVLLCAAMMVTCVSMVGLSDKKTIQLSGVAFGAFASAMGEATFLAMSSRFGDGQRVCLTAWSSGTGMAGIFGYLFVFFFTQIFGWSFAACSLAANSLAILWLLNFGMILSESQCFKNRFELVMGEGSLDDDHENLNDILASNCDEDNERRHGALENVTAIEGERMIHNDEHDESDISEATSSLDEEELIDLSSSGNGHLSVRDRMMIIIRLRDFTLPLFTVYVAEYTMQSGCWAAVGFPVDDKTSRDQFYLYSNWIYQFGVFFSRSSGIFFTISKHQLWVMPAMQCALLLFFILNGVNHMWWNWGLVSLAFVVGLLGGAVYVHSFILMAKITKPSQREMALGTASLADTFGIMVSNLLGVVVQGCMYGINGITDNGKLPTFKCGYEYSS